MDTKKSMGSIVAIVGGVVLIISAFLTWGKVSLDLVKFASALGIDASQLGPVPGTTQSVSGTDGWEGKVAILAGIVAVVVAVLAMRQARKGLAVLLIVAGIVGGGVALYDVVTVNNQKDSAIDDLSPQLQAAGIDPSTFSDAIDVSLAAGIWICLIGGIIVIAGGVMTRASEGEMTTAGTAAGMGSGMAMGSPMGAASAMGTAPAPAAPAPAAPPAPMTPEAPTMTPEAPAMPPAEASPPAGENAGEPAGGGDADGET